MADITKECTIISNGQIEANKSGEIVRDSLITAIQKLAADGNAIALIGTESHPDPITSEELVFQVEAQTENISPTEVPRSDSNRPVSSGFYYDLIYGNTDQYGNDTYDTWTKTYVTLAEAFEGYEERTYTPAMRNDEISPSYLYMLVDIIDSLRDIADTITARDEAQPVVVIFGKTPLIVYPEAIRQLFNYSPTVFTITDNGTYNVADYSEGGVRPVWSQITVDVPPFAPQELTVNENGDYSTGHRTPYTLVHVKVPIPAPDISYSEHYMSIAFKEKNELVMISSDDWPVE